MLHPPVSRRRAPALCEFFSDLLQTHLDRVLASAKCCLLPPHTHSFCFLNVAYLPFHLEPK